MTADGEPDPERWRSERWEPGGAGAGTPRVPPPRGPGKPGNGPVRLPAQRGPEHEATPARPEEPAAEDTPPAEDGPGEEDGPGVEGGPAVEDGAAADDVRGAAHDPAAASDPAPATGPEPGRGPGPEPAAAPDAAPDAAVATGSAPAPPPAAAGGGGSVETPAYTHPELMSLLGAWALTACSSDETAAVERHLTDCPPCAEEALRLRDAVTLLEPQRTLDLDSSLRPEVLGSCLARRPPRLPVPEWAEPYEAEAARLDALLRDFVDEDWQSPVRLKWFSGDSPVGQTTTIAGVLDHLIAVDGLLCPVLGLPDPLGADATGGGPAERTELRWQRSSAGQAGDPRQVRSAWRDQTRALVRAVGELPADSGRQVPYSTPEGFGGGALSLKDAFLDRAFACWVHATDIAEAVDYPYDQPTGPYLRQLVELAARRLPVSIADRRRAGLASSPGRLVAAGEPGRTLHLEVEGDGGGHFYIPLDSPTAVTSRDTPVAHVALEDHVFCKLAAGRITLEEAAAGADGDQRVIQDMLYATLALSRI